MRKQVVCTIMLFTAMIFLACAAQAQSPKLVSGGVEFWFPNLLPSGAVAAFEIDLIGGIYYGSDATRGGNFQYTGVAGGAFSASYTGLGCSETGVQCTFTGRFSSWNNPVAMPGTPCEQLSGLVAGTVTMPNGSYQVSGYYEQPECLISGMYFVGTGGLNLWVTP